MNPITLSLAVASALLGIAVGEIVNVFLAAHFVVAATIVALSLKMANAWQKFVILRAGKLQGVKGPGLFMIFPFIDSA
jgi:regulator of protease activity HflC (stomatin/prohibitin superfamily)